MKKFGITALLAVALVLAVTVARKSEDETQTEAVATRVFHTPSANSQTADPAEGNDLLQLALHFTEVTGDPLPAADEDVGLFGLFLGGLLLFSGFLNSLDFLVCH